MVVDLKIGEMRITHMSGSFVRFNGKVCFQPSSKSNADWITYAKGDRKDLSSEVGGYVDLKLAPSVARKGFELQDIDFGNFKKIYAFNPEKRPGK